MNSGRLLKHKFREAMRSVGPIIAIVLVLSMLFVPIPSGIMLVFLSGGVLLILGMMFFTLGAEIAISPLGEQIGTYMTRSRKIALVIGVSLILGIMITVSEPDLQVLAELVPGIPNAVLVLCVSIGVGVFLVVASARMLIGVAIRHVILGFYLLIFALCFFVPHSFIGVAFDAGGVTTGPMTVPFIMAMGVGIAAIRSDKHAANDSFGLVAISSIGPILAVLILGIVYKPGESASNTAEITEVADSLELFRSFLGGLPVYLKEIAVSLIPLILFMGVFQIVALKMNRRSLGRIGLGLLYTYIGLVLFLTGANVGFMPAGNYLGQMLASGSSRFVLIPVAMLIGFFIVRAEPAVYVLNHQVEELTEGGISARSMGWALSIGVACSLGLAMIMVQTSISVLWFLVPGYAIAIGLSFAVPKLYTAVAFDSGGVASGPMTAAFLVPLAQGVCMALGGNVGEDAFGVVAMVAMTPLITIQVMAFYSEAVRRRRTRLEAHYIREFEAMDDNTIIEL